MAAFYANILLLIASAINRLFVCCCCVVFRFVPHIDSARSIHSPQTLPCAQRSAINQAIFNNYNLSNELNVTNFNYSIYERIASLLAISLDSEPIKMVRDKCK